MHHATLRYGKSGDRVCTVQHNLNTKVPEMKSVPLCTRYPKTVDGIIKRIEEKFGKMTVTREKKHTFVGINIEFTTDNLHAWPKLALYSSGLCTG